jgi:hypothetical protein
MRTGNDAMRSYYQFWPLDVNARIDPPIVMNDPVVVGIHGDTGIAGDANAMLVCEGPQPTGAGSRPSVVFWFRASRYIDRYLLPRDMLCRHARFTCQAVESWGTKVLPASLYEAQLARRIGYVPYLTSSSRRRRQMLSAVNGDGMEWMALYGTVRGVGGTIKCSVARPLPRHDYKALHWLRPCRRHGHAPQRCGARRRGLLGLVAVERLRGRVRRWHGNEDPHPNGTLPSLSFHRAIHPLLWRCVARIPGLLC